jgi:uroporphyrinogen-III synthase
LRKDTLPEKLRAAGFGLDEVLCYNTCAANDIAINAAALVKQKGHPQWVVLFSPSGVQYTSREVPHIFQRTKICAFGPTTSEALQEHGLPVHTTFSAPYKPDRLLTLISEHGQPTSLV